MLWSQYLILSSTVLQAQFFLCPAQQFQFVDIGGTAKLSCASIGKIEDKGLSFSWYKRQEDEVPLLIKRCIDKNATSRFLCMVEDRKLTLRVSRAQEEDSGLYFCAQRSYTGLAFSNASSSLIVGDSYTPSTWVMLLIPPAHLASQSDQLACVVHGVSNLVQVFWSISGDLQQEGPILLVRNSSGSLTFLSLLPLPLDSHMNGKLCTCEVRLNSSSRSVKKSATLHVGHEDTCQNHTLVPNVLSLLALLLLPLNFLWIQCCSGD